MVGDMITLRRVLSALSDEDYLFRDELIQRATKRFGGDRLRSRVYHNTEPEVVYLHSIHDLDEIVCIVDKICRNNFYVSENGGRFPIHGSEDLNENKLANFVGINAMFTKKERCHKNARKPLKVLKDGCGIAKNNSQRSQGGL